MNPNPGKWSPRRQLAYGCLGVVLAGAAVLYCAGTLSILVRSVLMERASSAAEEDALPATPTPKPLPTFIQLPTGVLVPTPTQAPIPTREPPTITPTLDPNATLSPTASASPRASATLTRRVTATPTSR